MDYVEAVVIFVKNYNTVFPSGRQLSHFGRLNRTSRHGDFILFPPECRFPQTSIFVTNYLFS